MKKILETERLMLREMTDADLQDLAQILKDPIVMKAYEHAFEDWEVRDWLNNQKKRYDQHGFGLWAVILKETDQMVGQCGLTWQQWDKKMVVEIGYLLKKAFWHQGYATEAAVACKNYAFEVVKTKEVYSIIRDTNTASQAVAKRNGMSIRGRLVKHYHGIDMPHILYCVECDKNLFD